MSSADSLTHFGSFPSFSLISISLQAVKKRNKRLRKAIGEGEVPHLDTLEILKSQSFFTSSSLGHLVRRAESHLSLEGSSDSVENTDRKKKPRCPICLDEIQNGVVLGCGHRFCSDCIARMVAHDAEDAVLVHENELELRCCPVCQKPQILALGCEEVRRKIAEIWDSKKVTGGLSHHCNEEEGVEEDEEDEGCAVKPLTVILDLDQTMIYSSKTWRVSKDSSMETWTIRMAHVPFPVNVYLRPGLREFLKSMASKDLEMIVWTAGIYDYACPIIDQIEEYADVTFSKRFYRNSTTKTALHTTVKDLANLGTDLDRTVLVDDNPLSFSLQPFNGIPITPFLGIYNTIPGNSTNYLMHMLLPVIEELAEKEDVRPYLKEKFNMHGWFAINNIDILDSF